MKSVGGREAAKGGHKERASGWHRRLSHPQRRTKSAMNAERCRDGQKWADLFKAEFEVLLYVKLFEQDGEL